MNQPIFSTNEMFLSDLGNIDGAKDFIDYEK